MPDPVFWNILSAVFGGVILIFLNRILKRFDDLATMLQDHDRKIVMHTAEIVELKSKVRRVEATAAPMHGSRCGESG